MSRIRKADQQLEKENNAERVYEQHVAEKMLELAKEYMEQQKEKAVSYLIRQGVSDIAEIQSKLKAAKELEGFLVEKINAGLRAGKKLEERG